MLRKFLVLFLVLSAFPSFIKAQSPAPLSSETMAKSMNFDFTVSFEKLRFKYGEEIKMSYSLHNKSDSSHKLPLKNLFGHPIGSGISIINEGDTSICQYPSSHVLSSRLYSEEEFKEFHQEIKPGETFQDTIDLQDIPVFKEGVSGWKLPIGKYRVRFNYYLKESEEFAIEVVK